jgi:magnesium-transporting ATPase (P-type)
LAPNTDQTQVKITGLTAQEAEARLDQFGPNEPAATKPHSFFSDLLHVFMNPLTLILLIAAIVSAFTGDAVDAGIIGVIVLLSGAIDLSQTYRSQRAVNNCATELPRRPPPCATASGRKFSGVTRCRETSCGFPPEIWFPLTRAS